MNLQLPSGLKNTLEQYFEMLYRCDVDILDRIFLPSALLHTVRDGQAAVLALAQYREVLVQRAPPARSNATRDDRIAMADLIGESCACVKVSARVSDKHFVDYLSLLEVQGQWRIASKVYMQLA